MRSRGLHEVQQYRTNLAGVEALSLRTVRQFPRHAHDQFGIGVINFGAHRSWSGLGWVEAGSGDTIMVNPGEMHDGQPLNSDARGWRMLYFEPHVVAEEHAEDARAASLTLQPTVHDRRQAALFGCLFRSIVDPQPDTLGREECLLKLLVYAFRHHAIERPSIREAATPDVAKVVRLVEAAPEKAWTLAEMAAIADCSRFQILRGFRQATGATPHAYVVQGRVRRARRLLAEDRGPAEVSLEAGFADQSHMTRAFVRQIGVTPARYRSVVRGHRRAAISFKI
jgi:AraC-like DNA-binding protein